MATGVTNAKASQANNFRSKPGSVTSNIVTAPSRTVVKEPPPLFPPNPLLDELPKPKPDVYLLRKSVSIKQLFRSSPFFLQPQQKTKDIERYADKYFDKEPSLELNNVIVASSGMFPAELISDKDKKMLRANLLKRKVPDTIVQPSAVDVLEQTSKKGKKKSDSKKKETPKTTKRKKGSDNKETNTSPKAKGPTKGKSKKGKEIETTKVTPDKETPIRLSKLTKTIFPNRDEMDFQALTKWEEQEAKETEEIDEDQETNKKKKKTDMEEEDNEQQVDMEEDENLLDDDDYNNLFDNDDIEDDYNDAGGSDGEPYMD